jgi:hypothetical protein
MTIGEYYLWQAVALIASGGVLWFLIVWWQRRDRS